MEFYIALLQAISILALTGSSLGDRASVDCSLAEGKKSTNLHDLLEDGIRKCFVNVDNLNLQTVVDTEGLRETRIFFEEYCQKQVLIEDCLSKTLSHSTSCTDEIQDPAVQFLEDFLKTALTQGCVGGGRYVMVVMYSVFHHFIKSNLTRNEFVDCFAAAKSTGVGVNTLDASTKLLGLYREFKVFKKCLVNRIRGDNDVVFAAEVILNGIQRNMKCPHPDDGTSTLCATLEAASSTEEKMCPFDHEMDENEPPTFKSIFNFAGECAIVNLTRANVDELKMFTSVEEYRSFFNDYCKNQPLILNCVGDVMSNSKVCQNETNHQVMETFQDFLENSLDIGCKQDGVNLATMFSGIFNSVEPAVDKDTVRDCFSAADSMVRNSTNPDDTLSSMVLKVYRGGVSMQRCILNRASEVGSFKSVFAASSDELLRAAKCVNPDDGTIVRCETLVNNDHV